jgi:hypothetical protein
VSAYVARHVAQTRSAPVAVSQNHDDTCEDGRRRPVLPRSVMTAVVAGGGRRGKKGTARAGSKV